MLQYYRRLGKEMSVNEQMERRTRLQADLLQSKLDVERGKLLPVDGVMSAWEFILMNIRQRIQHHANFGADVKKEILSELKAIPVEDYRLPESISEHAEEEP